MQGNLLKNIYSRKLYKNITSKKTRAEHANSQKNVYTNLVISKYNERVHLFSLINVWACGQNIK